MRSAFALRIISGRIIYNFAFVALCGALQTHFHRRGRNRKLHLIFFLCEKGVQESPRLRSNESPGGAFKRRAVCVSRWRGLAPTSSAGRDKREIKNLDSAEHSQSESGGYLKSKKGYTPSLKISIPRFLPVENSLRICYDKKQRYSHKMLKMRKVIACVKVES